MKTHTFSIIHVKRLVVWLIYAKTILLLCLIPLSFILGWTELVRVALLLSFGLAIFSYLLLLVGLERLKFNYLIPYFFITFIFAMVLVVHFFIAFLDSANTRNTTSRRQIWSFAAQLAAITFEIYTLVLGWRLFNYICDRVMRDQLAAKGIMIVEEGETRAILPRDSGGNGHSDNDNGSSSAGRAKNGSQQRDGQKSSSATTTSKSSRAIKEAIEASRGKKKSVVVRIPYHP